MNQYQRPDDFVRERPEPGRPRRWTADELEHMVRAGIVNEIERIELIAGEIVQMPAKGNRHELVRNELTLYWARQLPLKLKFAEEVPLRLSEHDQPEPDIMLFPGSQNITQVTAASVLLVVEVSDSSLSSDLKIKALPEGMTLKFVDPAKILDESDKWEKLYKDIITNQAR